MSAHQRHTEVGRGDRSGIGGGRRWQSFDRGLRAGNQAASGLGMRASPTAEELRGRPVAIRAGDYRRRFSARRGRGPEEFQRTGRDRHWDAKRGRPRLDSLGVSGCSFGNVVFERILRRISERLAWRRPRLLRWTRLNEERLVRPTPMAVRGVNGAGQID